MSSADAGVRGRCAKVSQPSDIMADEGIVRNGVRHVAVHRHNYVTKLRPAPSHPWYHRLVEQLNADPFAVLKPPKLRVGDRVKFVSPASTPSREGVRRGAEIVTAWGLRVEMGRHMFDTRGHYLAGRDEDRLADINEALRDPGIRAIFATAGGKGAYRIADGLDFEAACLDPKPLIGFSETTILHLARC